MGYIRTYKVSPARDTCKCLLSDISTITALIAQAVERLIRNRISVRVVKPKRTKGSRGPKKSLASCGLKDRAYPKSAGLGCKSQSGLLLNLRSESNELSFPEAFFRKAHPNRGSFKIDFNPNDFYFCGGRGARSNAQDSGSCSLGIREFKSHPPHHNLFVPIKLGNQLPPLLSKG
jgi:hypothetical protein